MVGKAAGGLTNDNVMSESSRPADVSEAEAQVSR
jgi:hypothetical protein